MPMPTLHVQEVCLSAARNTCAADFANEIAGPGLDVALRAALHQQHERAVAEAAEQVVRLARLGDQSGELADEFLDRQRADVVGRASSSLSGWIATIWRMPALIGCDSVLLQLLHEEAPLQRAGRGVALQSFRQLLIDGAAVALLRRDGQAHRRLAIEVDGRQLDIERHARCRRRASRWRAANDSTTCPAGTRPARP